MPASLNERDKWCLNLFWAYGEGMITKEMFMETIEKIKYKITEEKHGKQNIAEIY